MWRQVSHQVNLISRFAQDGEFAELSSNKLDEKLRGKNLPRRALGKLYENLACVKLQTMFLTCACVFTYTFLYKIG